MSETAGCADCGNTRVDPVDVNDDGDMILKCRGCGKKLVLRSFLPTESPDKTGNIYSTACFASIRKGLKGAS